MAIRFPDPPDAVVAATRRLPSEERLSLFSGALDEAGGAPPSLTQPVFTAGLDAIVATDGDVERVAEAPTSWRCASDELGGAVALVTEEPAGEAHATSVGDDRFSPAIRRALATAEEDPRVGTASFEARLLRVPALKLLAVWLHAPDTEDLFVPVVPAAFDAVPGELYAAPEFQARLRAAAADTLSLYEQAERPDELGG